MSSKHLGRYVAELTGQHNLREADITDQMGLVAKATVGKGLRY